MVSASVLRLAALAAPLVAASAEPLTTSFKAVRNAHAAPDVHARGLSRYGRAVPEGLANLARRGHVDGHTVTDYNAATGEWSILASFGTPPQELPILLDTGSWDCVVYSTQSDKSGLPAGIPLYKPEDSVTARPLEGYTFDIIYGNGDQETSGDISASGDVFLDVLSIGGVTAPSQAVESIVNFTAGFTQLDATGIVGMALKKNNTVRPIKQNTFFDNIKDQLSLPVLVADLYIEAESHYDFGFINKSLITEPLTWTAVNTSDGQQGWWSISVDGYQVGSESYVESPFPSIVDTGTLQNLFPGPIVSAYYDKVPGAVNSSDYAAFIFPCDTPLPDFSVTISGKPFTIPGSLLNVGELTNNTCMGNIQEVPAATNGGLPQPNACIGASFMLQHLFVFDLGLLQIGLAEKSYIENATFVN